MKKLASSTSGCGISRSRSDTRRAGSRSCAKLFSWSASVQGERWRTITMSGSRARGYGRMTRSISRAHFKEGM